MVHHHKTNVKCLYCPVIMFCLQFIYPPPHARRHTIKPKHISFLARYQSPSQQAYCLLSIRRFISVFTRACHWSLSWERSIQSMSHPISVPPTLRCRAVSSIHIFQPKLCMHFSSPLYLLHAPIISSAFIRPTVIFHEEFQLWSPTSCNYLQPSITSSLRQKGRQKTTP
jgi:hypothetical protein